MRAKDVHVGNRYLCRIAGELREVIVTLRLQGPRGEAFRVRRADKPLSGIQLKARSASALRPLPGSEDERLEAARVAKEKPARERRAARQQYREARYLAMPPIFANRYHAMVSCRSVHQECRQFIAETNAVGRQLYGAAYREPGNVPAWIKAVLQRHLANRVTFLEIRDGHSIETARQLARLAESAGWTVSAEDMRLARMLEGRWADENTAKIVSALKKEVKP